MWWKGSRAPWGGAFVQHKHCCPHFAPGSNENKRGKGKKAKAKFVLLAEQPNMKVKRQGEKVELAQGGNYTVQKIYSNKNKTTGRETIQEICPQEKKTSKEIINSRLIQRRRLFFSCVVWKVGYLACCISSRYLLN